MPQTQVFTGRTLVLTTKRRQWGRAEVGPCRALFAAPWRGFEPRTWRLRAIPRFPSGTDYLFAIALEALGAGHIVSEPSRSVLRAWLRIAMATTRRRVPAIRPVTPLDFSKGLPLNHEPLALPLSYQGVVRG